MNDSSAPVALVTGAAGSIGAAVAKALADAGYALILTDLSDAPSAAPTGARWHVADMSREPHVERLLANVDELDLIVHCAGKVGVGPITNVSLQDWNDVMAVNLSSAFLLARGAQSQLAARRGQLVLLSSSNGINGGTALSGPAYAVAKAGIINLTRYLAKEWGPLGIRVNCIAPGPVDTPMLDRLGPEVIQSLVEATPLKRLAKPEEVAAIVVALATGAGDHLTGTVHNISGGLVLD